MATQQFYVPNQVFVSNNASTATGVGVSAAMPQYGQSRTPPSKFTWQTITTGSPSGVSVNLEGSIDGANWVILDNSTATAGEIRCVVNYPMKFVRTNLATLTGGTAPTVTGQFVAAQ